MADRKALYASSVGYGQIGTAGDFLTLPGLFLADDAPIELGNTSAAPNATIIWETADPNANYLLFALPDGGATDVPVFAVGDATALNKDLGLYDGVTAPSIVALDATATKGIRIYHDGTNGYLASSSGDVVVSPNLQTGTITFPADAGAVTIVNMPITAAAINTEESYSFQIDSTTVLKVYGESTGAGGLQNARVAVSTLTPRHTLDVNGSLRYDAAQFYDEFWTLTSAWTTRTTTGSVALQAASNGRVRLTTGATTTNEESLDWNDLYCLVNTKRPIFEVRLQLESVANCEAEFGLFGADADDYITVRFDASVGNMWKLLTSKDSASTSSDDGAVATVNEVVLRVEWTSDTALEWFIDGVSQGTASGATVIPTAALQPVIAIRTEADTAKYVDVDYVKIWQDRT